MRGRSGHELPSRMIGHYIEQIGFLNGSLDLFQWRDGQHGSNANAERLPLDVGSLLLRAGFFAQIIEMGFTQCLWLLVFVSISMSECLGL